MDALPGGAIKDVKRPLVVGEGSHPAAAAGAGGVFDGGLLAVERSAFVPRASDPDSPADFATRSRARVPGHINISGRVSGDAPAAVEAHRELHNVSLRLEGGPVVVQSRIEHRRRARRTLRPGLTRPEPRDVDSRSFSDGYLRTADGPDGHGAVRRAVYADGIRESFRARLSSDVENVSRLRFPFEIDQVKHALLVHVGLWLDAAVRSLHQGYFGEAGGRLRSTKDARQEKRRRADDEQISEFDAHCNDAISGDPEVSIKRLSFAPLKIQRAVRSGGAGGSRVRARRFLLVRGSWQACPPERGPAASTADGLIGERSR